MRSGGEASDLALLSRGVLDASLPLRMTRQGTILMAFWGSPFTEREYFVYHIVRLSK